MNHITTMQKKFYKEKRTTGVSGAFVVDAIVCTFGRIQPHWNCRMAQMDGSVSFWMANWQQCTQVAAPKMETIIQVFFGCERKNRIQIGKKNLLA